MELILGESNQPPDAGPKGQAAERWFGYGRWDAPFWFIGKEPGGEDDPKTYQTWDALGGKDLIDCREHDRLWAGGDLEQSDWHGAGANAQPTWRGLIALLLAYKGAEAYDLEAIRDYQVNRWGRTDSTGETAVLELSAVARPSTQHHDDFSLTHLDRRIGVLQARLREHKPKLVVFYGMGSVAQGGTYVGFWRAISGHELATRIPYFDGITAFVITPHPTAHGVTNEYWTALGHQLRELTG